MGAFEIAKSEALRLADRPGISVVRRVYALYLAATACSHLKLFTAAFALLDHAERIGSEHEIPPPTQAHLAHLRGLLEYRSGGFVAAAESFADAMRRFDGVSNSYEACRCRINLASSLIDSGELDSAMSHLEIALRGAEHGGFHRLAALALSNMVLVQHQRGDHRATRKAAARSNQIAIETGYNEVLFRNTFYLAELAKRDGDDASSAMYERTLHRLLKDVDADSNEARAVAARVAALGDDGAGGGGA
jgi:tetratricopeptide (TPR) repeat protein